MNDTAPQWELISFVDYLSSRTQFMMRVAAVAAGEDDLCGKKIAGGRTNLPTALQPMIDNGENAALPAKWNLPASSAMSHVIINGVP
jgi:hypothetical protein